MPGHGRQFFIRSAALDEGGSVLYLYVNFGICRRDVRGYIALLIDLPSLEPFRKLIRESINRVVATDDFTDVGVRTQFDIEHLQGKGLPWSINR
jgi:hypothetical protein